MTEYPELLTRIRTIKQTYGITDEVLAKHTGMERTTICNQLGGRYKLDTRILLALLDLCPSLSSDYLMRGTGPIHTNPAGEDYDKIIQHLELIEKHLKI